MEKKEKPFFENNRLEQISDPIFKFIYRVFFAGTFYERNEKNIETSLLKDIYTKNKFDSDFLKQNKRLVRMLPTILVWCLLWKGPIIISNISKQENQIKNKVSFVLREREPKDIKEFFEKKKDGLALYQKEIVKIIQAPVISTKKDTINVVPAKQWTDERTNGDNVGGALAKELVLNSLFSKK